MSTLNVSNITDGTDTVETGYVLNGSAKAWVHFNAQGTLSVSDSFNVSSMTDNGTGDFTKNFSSSMASASSVTYQGSSNLGNASYSYMLQVLTAASVRFQLRYTNTGTLYDTSINTFTTHGDLA